MSADLFEAFGKSQQSNGQQSQAQNSEAEPITSSLIDVPDFQEQELKASSIHDARLRSNESLWTVDRSGNDVLFDASLEDSQDDFGDFKDVGDSIDGPIREHNTSNGISIAPKDKRNFSFDDKPLIDLLSGNVLADSKDDTEVSNPVLVSLNSDEPKARTPQKTVKDIEEDSWGDFEAVQTEGGPLPHVKVTSIDARTKIPEFTQDNEAEVVEEEWDTFEELEDQPMKHQQSFEPPKSTHILEKTGDSSVSTRTKTPIAPMEVDRPTNIPPPAILLEVLTTIFGQLGSKLSTHDNDVQETSDIILMIHTVAARIIVGRSLRWKRDKILIQSTKIGQAGKSGGMKLIAVNKSEAIKEEREVNEAISSWFKNAHKFNAVLAKTKRQHLKLTLASTMSIKILKGIITTGTPLPCPVCGLKRDERVVRIDDEAEDSFGEFWVAHWGHKDCQDFWNRYKDLLRHR